MSFVKDIALGAKQKRTKEELKKAEDLRVKARDEDSKMVTGVFHNLEAPGASVEFSYRKYKEDSHKTYTLQHLQKYTIPIGVAKHINNMTAVPIRDYVDNPDGTKSLYTRITSKRQRYQFLSTEFM